MQDNATQDNAALPVETHPWAPYIPGKATALLLGTFPPGRHRWCMDFYYPNATNDFWRIIGLLFEHDAAALYDSKTRAYDLPRIRAILDTHGIALSDTVLQARRTRGTASDKDLEVVTPRDIAALAKEIPGLRGIAATGQKAAEIIAAETGTPIPTMGQYVMWNDIQIWRLPSTSRAYPLPLAAKAGHYRRFFTSIGSILQ